MKMQSWSECRDTDMDTLLMEYKGTQSFCRALFQHCSNRSADLLRHYHRLNGLEFEQTPEDSEGQGSLACCSPWRLKESDTT